MGTKPTIRSFKYVPTANGDEGLILHYQETASQTFKAGDLVVQVAAGTVSLATAGGTNQILGIAMKDASNVASAMPYIPVLVIRPFDLFVANFVSGTTFAISMVGENHEIVRTSAGNWEVAAGTTAADVRVKIVNTAEPHGSPTSGGPLNVRFLTADSADQILQFGTDSAT